MSEHNYYKDQLEKLNLSRPIQAKFFGSNDSNFITLNLESIREVRSFLSKVEQALRCEVFGPDSAVMPCFYNADYWQVIDMEETFQNLADAKKEYREEELCAVHSKLLLSDAQGVYIPKIFAEICNPIAWRLSQELVDAIKEGPENEYYWDDWQEVLENACHKDQWGNEWRLEQEGALYTYLNIEA